MRRVFVAALLFIFIASSSAMSQALRSVRQISPRGTQPQEKILQQQNVDDDLDTLRYEDPDFLPNYLTLPDDAQDHYYNVWFTPLYAPFIIMEVHIPLYDIIQSDIGEPGLRIVIFESSEQFGVPGYPGQAIDSIDVPFEDLEFGDENLIWNVIDLSQMEMRFIDLVDFHVAVDVIFSDTTETDTLAIYMDDGKYTPEGTRSGLYDGINLEWSKLTETEGYEKPYNFAIHCVISNRVGVTDLLKPSQAMPTAVLINPAYPNPFNSSSTVNFRVKTGVSFTANLLDFTGRRIKILDNGVGGQSRHLTIDGAMLSSGSYFVQVATPEGSQMIPLSYLR